MDTEMNNRRPNSGEDKEQLLNDSGNKNSHIVPGDNLSKTNDYQQKDIGGIKHGSLNVFIMIACLAPLQFGFLNGYWNGMQYPFRAVYKWETEDDFDSWSGIIQACNILGGLAGVFLTFPLLPLGRWKGLMVSNIIIIAQNDVTQTWEGDNNVLLQQTSKYLLDIYRKKMKGKEVKSKTTNWIDMEFDSTKQSGLESEEDFLKISNLIKLIEYRVNKQLQQVVMKLGEEMGNGINQFDSWNNLQPFYLQKLALFYGDVIEAIQFDSYITKTNQKKQLSDYSSDVLQDLLRLFIIDIIEKDSGLFLEDGHLTGDNIKLCRDLIFKLLQKIKPHAVKLADAMKPSDPIFESMIGPEDGDLYNSITQRIYNAPDAMGRISTWQQYVNKSE